VGLPDFQEISESDAANTASSRRNWQVRSAPHFAATPGGVAGLLNGIQLT